VTQSGVKRWDCPRAHSWLAVAPLLTLLACGARAPYIATPEPKPEPAPTTPHGSPALPAQAGPAEPRLRAPISRDEVLRALSLLQSSLAGGHPALEELLSESAGLSAPSTDGRRSVANRQTIASALSASFVDGALTYDPLDVAVHPSAEAEVASVYLLGVAGGSPRRIVLSVEVGYDEGVLRIQDITLTRAP